MKFKSIQLKIGLLGGLCLLGVLAIAVGISVYSVRNTQATVMDTSMANAKKAARAQLTETGKSVSMEIKSELDVALDAARTLADVFSCIKDEDISLNIDRDRISGILRGVLSKNQTFLGTYTAWEPNALDDLDSLYQGMESHDETGRFIPYWSVGEGGQFEVAALADYESAEMHPNGVRFGDYYMRPRERKQECAIDPYPYEVQGKITWLTSLVAPIVVKNTFYGIAGVDMDMAFLQDLVEKSSKGMYEGAGTVAVVSNMGIIAGHSGDAELNGKLLKAWRSTNWQQDLQAIRDGQVSITESEANIEVIIPFVIGRTGQPWAVVMTLPNEALFADAMALGDTISSLGRRDISVQTVVGLCALIAGLITLWIIAGGIARPLKKAAELSQAVAQGDLTQQIQIDREDEIGVLGKSLNGMVANLQELVGSIQQASTQVSAASEELAGSSQNLSSGAAEQAANLEETSASIEQLTASIQSNAKQANSATNNASRCAERAQEGGQAVLNTVEAMKRIANQITIIDDIADQTNLLALNAAIEAARAGEMGKGFAVVAVEVRKLAERSQSAAKEISELAQRSVVAAEDAGRLIQEVVPEIQETAAMVADIQSSCREQASGAEQMSRAIEQLDSVTQQNASTSEESAAASEELSAQSSSMMEIVGQFKIAAGRSTRAQSRMASLPQSQRSPKPGARQLNAGMHVNPGEVLEI